LEKAIVLNLTGNAVSLLDQSNTTTPYANATSPANINTVLGDEKLYLKGGEGSLSIIELFGPDADSNGVADELETIRKNGWLINEANLVFHVDAGAMLSGQVAKRIYLYDFENNRPIFDYVTDPTTSGSNSKNGKASYGGILIKDNGGNGTYKLRITNQIRVLVQNKDSTNIRLGVVVTEDINTTTSNKLRTSTPSFSQVPKASVMSPSGTILYGGKSTIPEDKRLKLEIYYTKPN
jgi:hypothetical protein